MPTPTKGPRLGGGPAHERLMLANLATSLFEHDRITTTEAKAKRLRPLAERLITFAKRGDLHARRRVMTVIRDKGIVHKLFTQIGPLMAERPGGPGRDQACGGRGCSGRAGGRRDPGRRRGRGDRGRRAARGRRRGERGRLLARRGLHDQGQPRLRQVPRAGRSVVRPDDRRDLVHLGRGCGGRRLHEGRQLTNVSLSH